MTCIEWIDFTKIMCRTTKSYKYFMPNSKRLLQVTSTLDICMDLVLIFTVPISSPRESDWAQFVARISLQLTVMLEKP